MTRVQSQPSPPLLYMSLDVFLLEQPTFKYKQAHRHFAQITVSRGPAVMRPISVIRGPIHLHSTLNSLGIARAVQLAFRGMSFAFQKLVDHL